MYVSIDLQAMRAVHVHPVHRVVSLLAYLELPHVPVRVKWIGTADPLLEFTELELRTLLVHLGVDSTAYHTCRALAALVHEKLHGLPVAEANEAELLAQVAAIAPTDKEPRKYARGATVAAKPQTLFPTPVPTVLHEGGPVIGWTSPAAAPPAAPAHVAKAQAAPAAPRAAGGGVVGRINAACEEAWVAAGSPAGAEELAAVRKAALAALVAAGVNENSAKKGTSLWLRERAK